MRLKEGWGAALAALTIATGLAAPAAAGAQERDAQRCAEPTSDGWQRVAPERVGFDAARLQSAIDYGSATNGFSIRVYRHGCLAGVDRLYPLNRDSQYESWSLAKSVTALVFGRAMTLGLISPDDPVGALLPEADLAHGRIRMRDLLTMSSGLRWNGLRDYDLAMPDRLRDALTVGIAHDPGTWFEYSQSGPALLAAAVERAVGEDVQAFAQRELFGPIGIPAGTWRWIRDGKGNTQGFFGVNARTDDFARFGELMRRGGVWRGRRLLSKRFVREAITPSRTNGCYGYLIWLNRGTPCVSPTITERPISRERYFPRLPVDTYHYQGLFGQIVTVLPTQGIVVARNGQDSSAGLAGGANAEEELYLRVLAALTDGTGGDGPRDGATVPGDDGRPNPDKGFQYALFEPQEYAAPFVGGPLPPAGPPRARALRLRLAHATVGRGGRVALRATCPGRARLACTGKATLTGARGPAIVRLQPGEATLLRFTLRRAPRRGARTLTARAVLEDGAGGTSTAVAVTVRPRRR